MRTGAPLAVCAALALTTSLSAAQRAPVGADRPTPVAWTVRRSWDARAEAEFSRWVHDLGAAVHAHRCTGLAQCLNNPAINPLHEPGRAFTFRADCADVPYILRGYYSYRTGRPFVYRTRLVSRHPWPGHGPVGERWWTDFSSPRRLLHDIGSEVNASGFRVPAASEDTDFYPVNVRRETIHPGTAYFDPDGHVLVVWDVRPDGTVMFIDGHPGGSFTSRPLTAQIDLGTARQGGGFRNFRPIRWTGTRPQRPRNAELSDFDPVSQYDRASHRVSGVVVPFDVWVRRRLAR